MVGSNGDNLPLLSKARQYHDAERARAAGLYPYFRPISSAQDTEVSLNGKRVIMLGSNSYLGLTNNQEVKEAAKEAVEKYGSGCAGSRFLNGTLDIHLELEQELAALVRKEAALLFSTGFQTNLGVISALVGKRDYVIVDKEDHASIVDGGLLCFGQMLRFVHNDMASLEARLEQCDPGAGKLIAVDGVFSMGGDICDLPNIVRLAETHGAVIMIDDAHAIGVLGHQGAGTAQHFGLTDHVQIVMGTFSKSLASLGGFVASDKSTIEYLKHHARALIFSASISPANTAAALASLQIMKREPERLARLWKNTTTMTDGLHALGFDTGGCETPIIPVRVGHMDVCFKFCKRLEEEGIFVNPIVPPAVAPNETLLRVSLMATHTDSQIAFALEKFGVLGRECGVI
jgi:8-amino-7-oxononanoate synthase